MSENDARTMILKMLAEGKISVAESERLLNAVNKEFTEKESTKNADNNKSSGNFPNIPFLEATKLGIEIKNIAQTVHDTVNKTIKQVEPCSKDLKDKMREFGNWMEGVVETVASEITNHNGIPADSMSVDFIVPAPANIDNYKQFIIENLYGEVSIEEGPDFKLLVNGQISKNTLGEMQSSEWFSNNAIRLVDETMYIGFDVNTSIKAIINLKISLPAGSKILCKTINSPIIAKGQLSIDKLKTINGNIRIDSAELENAEIETVSGVIQVENSKKINAKINTTSGDLMITHSKIGKLESKSVNGDFIMHDSEISLGTEVSTITTSGDITIAKMSGPWKQINALSRSGDVLIDWHGNSNNSNTTITSGGEGAIFSAESLSGNIKFR